MGMRLHSRAGASGGAVLGEPREGVAQQLVQGGVDGELAVADGLDEAHALHLLRRHHLLLPGRLPLRHLLAQPQLVHNLLLRVLSRAL